MKEWLTSLLQNVVALKSTITNSMFLCVWWFVLDRREADALYSPSPPPLPSILTTSSPGNRSVTLPLTRSEGINTFALCALSPTGHGPMGHASVALQPAAAREDQSGGVTCWQPSPKSLGRPWRGASQLKQGQK